MSDWAAKRFWTDVRIEREDTGFVIRLDDRGVNTPAKRPLIVPTEAIAKEIAAEWDAQTDLVDPGSMPWTRSANAAIDKVGVQADEVKAHLAGYADTDLLLYRAESPEALVQCQNAAWDPVLDWIDSTFGARLKLATGIMPVSQDKTALSRLTQAMDGMSDFQLTGFHDMVTLTGSFSLALAGVENYKPADDLWDLSRVDEDWQIEQWGEDEEAKTHANIKKTAFLHATELFHSSL